MSNPSHSIIIPTYNRCSDLLAPCLDSVLKYTTVNDFSTEIIVVANGCTDETKQYVEGLQIKFHNIHLLWFDEAMGFVKATNEGIKKAKGEFVVLLNNDTVMLNQEYNQWINTLRKPFEDTQVGMTGIHEIYSAEISRKFLVFYCVMIRKEVFDKIGLLDEMLSPGFGDDIDFCARLCNAGYTTVNCEANPEKHPTMLVGSFPLYHRSSATFHANEKQSQEYEKIVSRNLGILKRRYNKSENKIKYSIIIPTYNNCETLLKPCLESLKATTDLTDVEVIIIANGCTDSTEEYVNSLGEPFRLLFYKEKLGFTKATNIGLKDAQGEYIVLLNNDVILYQSEKGWLNILREPFDSGEKVGMTGVMLFKGDVGFSNDFIMFFCCMTTRKVVDDIGILDENFAPAGVEDVDYGLRLTLAGYELIEVPNDGKTKRSSNMSTGTFPIYHCGNSSYSKESDWHETLIKNNSYLKKKFPEYFNGIDWIEKMDKNKPKVYDCFLFFNELDLLELRLEELNDVVDFFVITESPITHKGDSKPLYYQENKERFSKYHHKIIYILVDDFPHYEKDDFKQYWNREQWQRNKLIEGLKKCEDHDIIIVSDADEIPSIEAIKNYNGGGIKSLEQKLFYYDFHHETEKKWTCAKIMQYKDVREGRTLTAIDTSLVFSTYLRNIDHERIKNGGWHFSYLADTKGIIQKLKSFSHQEFNTHPYTEEGYIKHCIDSNKNLFSDDKLKYVEIDGSYPNAILNNIDKWKQKGFIKSPPSIHSVTLNIEINYDALNKKLNELDWELYNELFKLNLNQLERSEVESKTIIDIGGNKGYFSIQCMQLGAKETYCFEPVKKFYDTLVHLTKDIKDIHTYNLAVLDGSIDQVSMHIDGLCSNIWGKENIETARCVSLVEALSYVEDKSNMALKLDCEGSEFEIILNTPKEVIRKFSTIYIEIHDEMNPNYIHKTDLLLKYIEELGFELKKGLQAGTYMPDGSFVAAAICIYKCLRIKEKKEKFTIGYINHSEEDLDKYLQPSINELNKEEYEIIFTSDENCPSKNYNRIIEESKNKYIILLHQDMRFHSDFLESIRKTIETHPDFGVLGLVGFDEFAKLNRFTLRAITDHPQKVDFLDSCCIIINKENNIQFDETTFNDFHLYVEDYCMQAREKGLQNYTILADFGRSSDCKLRHIGSTYIKNGNKMWGKYDEYYGIFLKKWVKKRNITLRTDSYSGTVIHNADEIIKPKICIIIQATGNYHTFVKNLVESINMFFMRDCYKDVIVLSDTMPAMITTLDANCIIHNRTCKSVNKASYFFELMLDNLDLISKADYCYKMDADMVIYKPISEKDILPGAEQNYSIVKHFAFDQKRMTSIQPSDFSVKIPIEYQNCDGWQSCLFGGRTNNMIELAKELDGKIKTDRVNNKMWGAWEEPYVNWYFALRKGEVRTLSPTYATPLYWHRFHPDYKESYLKSVGNEQEQIFHFNHTVQFGGHEVG